MRVEIELEIGRWLKTAKTELEIRPNQIIKQLKSIK